VPTGLRNETERARIDSGTVTLFADELCSQSILDFLAAIGAGATDTGYS